MKEILIATYIRPDTYRGYNRINHYHIPTEIRCYIYDNSKERSMGITINGNSIPDYYDVVEYNYREEATYRHHFADKSDANNCVKAILTEFKDFKKI